jgi:hypothetical protein
MTRGSEASAGVVTERAAAVERVVTTERMRRVGMVGRV